MNEGKFQMIQLDELKPNPLNPRKNFSGKKFDELIESVRVKGVLEPILVRPLAGKKNAKTPFEIIAGERRFRASCEIANANGGMKAHTIPAIVREMSDNDAFDVMTIENLQREDLTEMEEARSFRIYIDRHGDDAIADLAQRCGIHPGYIRRRLQVLTLPADVLKAWEGGEIKFGHCEQLLRLKDEKQILEVFEDILEREWQQGGEYIMVAKTVAELKSEIDRMAVKLSCAKFNIEDCAKCPRNTEVQKAIFDLSGLEKACCLDPECFKEKQRTWLNENWKKYGKAHKTKGWRFYFELSYNDFHNFSEWGAHPTSKCSSCENFVTLLEIDGKAKYKQSCVGTSACFSTITRTAKAQDQAKKEQKKKGVEGESEVEVPRVDWHGVYFREVFFHKRIPEVLEGIPAGDDKVLRLILASMLHEHHFLKEEFAKNHKGISVERYCFMGNENVWPVIEKMDTAQLQEALKEAATAVMLEGQVHGGGFGSRGRRLVATHLGIDLQKEWRIDAEYLEKKTIAEILSFGKKLGIFEDEKAKKYLEGIGRKSFEKSSKKELVGLFTDGGLDLAGKVPAEILEPEKER